MSWKEELRKLSNKFQSPRVNTETINRDALNELGIFVNLEYLAVENLKPYIDNINNELLNGRGNEDCICRADRKSNNYGYGIVLTWDKYPRSGGKRLELGVQHGGSNSLYYVAGHNMITVYGGLLDWDGNPNPEWKEKTEFYLLDLFQNNPHYLEF